MAPPPRKRLKLGSSSNLKKRHEQQHQPTSSSSLASTPGATNPHQDTTEGPTWTLKDPPILRERVKSKLRYLLNWDGIDPNTGENYIPTWELPQNVSPVDRAEWQRKKNEGFLEKVVVGGQTEYHLRPVAEVAEANTPEVKDSYEEDSLPQSAGQQLLRVEITVSDNFNPEAYAIIEPSQVPQNTQYSGTSLGGSTQSSSDLDLATPESSSPNLNSSSHFVIPDSQDFGASATYQPPLSEAPSTQEHASSAEVVSPVQLEVIDLGTIPCTPSEPTGTLDSRASEPCSQSSPSAATYQEAPDSTVPETTQGLLSNTQENSASTPPLLPDLLQSSPLGFSSQQEEDSASIVVPSAATETQSQSQAQQSQSQSRSQHSSRHLLSPPLERVGSAGSPTTDPDLQDRQPSIPSSSFPFQTQLFPLEDSTPIFEEVRASCIASQVQATDPNQELQSQETSAGSTQDVSTKDPIPTEVLQSPEEQFPSLPSPASHITFTPEPTTAEPSLLQSIEFSSPTRPDTPSPSSRTIRSPRVATGSSARMSSSRPSMWDRWPQSRKDQWDRWEVYKAKKLVKIEARLEAERLAAAMPPSPAPLTVSQSMPLREVAAAPPAFEKENSTPPSMGVEKVETALELSSDDKYTFHVPLPINSITREIYGQTIKNSYQQRVSFLKGEEDGVAESIDKMISDLHLLCSHSDLIADDLSTQRAASDELQARYAENQSTKCMFIVELLNGLKYYDERVAILVRPGRMFEILESLIQYHGYRKTELNRPEYHCIDYHTELKVDLISTDYVDQDYPLTPASLVVAFDSTFQAESSYSTTLRKRPVGRAGLLIYLTINHSVEHLDLCIGKHSSGIEAKRRLVRCLSEIGGDVGRLDEEYAEPPEAAKEVALFVLHNASDPGQWLWPCKPMPEIGIMDLDVNIDPTPQPDSNNFVQTAPTTDSPVPTPGYFRQLSLKRHFGELSDDESSKRQRLTPTPGETSNSHYTAVDNDSPLQTFDNGGNAGQSIQGNETRETDVSSLLQRVTDLELKLRETESSESDSRRLNVQLEKQLRDVESSFLTIQPRYQEALNDRGHFQQQCEEALIQANTNRQKHEARIEEVSMIKEQRQNADTALAAARAELASSAIPEVAEIERLREEVRLLRADQALSKRQKASKNNELDSMRKNYIAASTAAAEAASELRAMQEEIGPLRKRASDNLAKIHQVQHSQETAAHLSTIRNLRAQNQELQRELEKKSTELAASLNGRRPTRGTPVSGSPLLGNTQSPGPARNIGRVMQASGNGSRGNSPSTGEIPPNVGRSSGSATFSDQFYTQVASSRFGNHLQ